MSKNALKKLLKKEAADKKKAEKAAARVCEIIDECFIVPILLFVPYLYYLIT